DEFPRGERLRMEKEFLGVSPNSLSFYLNSDQMHRNVFVVAPGQKLPVQVVLDDCMSAST
ncbi:MAG: hypothetical protein R6U98_12335, partial [Pirellulaceae bacterium]